MRALESKIETAYMNVQKQSEPEWLKELRNMAIEYARKLPWPESRYTKLKGFRPNHYTLEPVDFTPERDEGEPGKLFIEFEDGRWVRLSGDPDALGVRVVSFQDLLKQEPDKLKEFLEDASRILPGGIGRHTALLHALWSDGLYIEGLDARPDDFDKVNIIIRETLRDQNRIRLLPFVVRTGRYRTIRILHEVQADATTSGLYIRGVGYVLNAGSKLEVHSVEYGTSQLFRFETENILAEQDAHMVRSGGFLTNRMNIVRQHVALSGPGAEYRDARILFGTGRQHFDFQSLLFHEAPNTTSEVNIRAVLRDRARAVFFGDVRIYNGSRNSRAYLQDHVLLLNPGAHADSIPALEIEENEVWCSHSASVSPIDEDKVFYLCSRGLTEEQARFAIVEGFFEPVFQSLQETEYIEHLRDAIRKKWEDNP